MSILWFERRKTPSGRATRILLPRSDGGTTDIVVATAWRRGMELRVRAGTERVLWCAICECKYGKRLSPPHYVSTTRAADALLCLYTRAQSSARRVQIEIIINSVIIMKLSALCVVLLAGRGGVSLVVFVRNCKRPVERVRAITDTRFVVGGADVKINSVLSGCLNTAPAHRRPVCSFKNI